MEHIVLNEERNVSLTVYLQPTDTESAGKEKKPAILILPGGAYQGCTEGEAEPVALEYLKVGFQAFVLRYSVNVHATWPNPLNDYEQAMNLIKEHAEQWNVCTDRIAVIGFSAGGHLAASAATMAKNRPNAAILCYPAILQDICDVCEPGLPVPSDMVDNETCPCFIVAARDDNVVHIDSVTAFQQALSDKDIMFESHVYAYGKHAFALATNPDRNWQPARLHNWIADSVTWLGEVWGAFSETGYAEPLFHQFVNGNHNKMLSVDCTIEYLRTFSDEVAELLKEELAFYDKMTPSELANHYFGSLMSVKDLSIIGYSIEKIKNVDKKLKRIPNKKAFC